MKKSIIIYPLFAIFFAACSPDPRTLTTTFLDALQARQYDNAEKLVSPQIREQIAIIRQDNAALFNGQEWKYTVIENNGSGAISYKIALNDGTQIWQMARLTQTTKGWKIESIETKKITYSATAIKTREYWEHSKQALITPLDLEDITKQKLENHIGQFIMISGYLCTFEDKNKQIMIRLGAEDRVPLLAVSITGPAADSAKKQHAIYSHIDSMVESPLGNTFTAIGLLQRSGGKFNMVISNPQNSVIGRFLRYEKTAPVADISGTYVETEGCGIVVIITKKGAGYQYQLTTPEHTYEGKFSLDQSADKVSDILFGGITYAESDGDEKRVGLGGQLSGDTITIQNYGNSMNYYVALGDCSEKYIRLVKIKNQTGSH
ncbi:hypothetical protein ACVW0P_002274 [Mucilaginibacter sp. UYNi724]